MPRDDVRHVVGDTLPHTPNALRQVSVGAVTGTPAKPTPPRRAPTSGFQIHPASFNQPDRPEKSMKRHNPVPDKPGAA